MKRILLACVLLGVAIPALASPPSDAPVPRAVGSPAASEPVWSGVRTPAHLSVVVRAALCEGPARAREPLEALLKSPGTPGTYEAAAAARALAEGSAAFANSDPAFSTRLREAANAALEPVKAWLADYPQMQPVHGTPEPTWLRGQPEVASQALLAWIALEEAGSDPVRRQAIAQMAEGLQKLLRGDFSRYPYGAHFSYVTSQGRPRTFVTPVTGEAVAGASWIVERSYSAEALARAGRLLGNTGLLESAQREGLGVLAHLAVSGQIPYGFSPRPELEPANRLGVLAVVENLAALAATTEKPIFGVLAGTAASLAPAAKADKSWGPAADALIASAVKASGSQRWAAAKDTRAPFGFQVIEAENGRAVDKAFEAFDIRYPGGTPGKLAVVGRENMFWIRFDVDREDEYLFYLSFLKSEVGGGLVSVMMRIDGDKIFQVNLAGASDDPFVDVDLVAGPRHLRQGPHSFGIRFSGLLMSRPAVLDSVIVQPAVGRRWLRLPDGRGALVMKSLGDDPIKIRMQELDGQASPNWQMVSGMGNPVPPKVTTDRRGRAWLEMPAGGVAVLEWPGAIPGDDPAESEATK